MAILLYNNKNKNLTSWVKALKNYDENLDIRIYPNIGNINDITFVITWPFEKGFWTQFSNLRAICSMGAGVNHIVNDNTINKNIHIIKLMDKNLVSSMWEYLLSTVMFYVSNINKYVRQQENLIWKEIKVKKIQNTTIGIMGLGQIGKNIAKNFSNLGFKVKGYSNSKKIIKNILTYNKNDLVEFLQNVDILISILPLTNETKKIFDLSFFSKMKKNSIFINVGRGGQLVEKDLIKAINKKYINYAFLDVFKKEPLNTNHAFWTHKDINISPHIASITDEKSVAKQIVNNYYKISKNKLPKNTVNRKKGY